VLTWTYLAKPVLMHVEFVAQAIDLINLDCIPFLHTLLEPCGSHGDLEGGQQ
jgi:hypothetical protein